MDNKKTALLVQILKTDIINTKNTVIIIFLITIKTINK